MYLATLSDLANEPVLIWEEFVATAKSAINVSSESPDLWEIIVLKPFLWAKLITSIVSVIVPIWFGLINMALATSCLIPLFNLSLLVTNKSSPTIWVFLLLKWLYFS